MFSQKEIQSIVKEAFSQLDWQREPIGLYAPQGYILSLGGKKIRPTLTLMAANLFSESIEEAVNAALGLEIFHNFTLLHDDIMDKAPMRRNQPAVHVKWNENTAILSGDAMLIKAYQLMAEVADDKRKACLDIFSQTALEVCEGQQYDMDFETRSDVSADEYIEMIRLKTSVLLAACLKIGAVIGGANEEEAQQLYDFGINLGLGFQLKDDWLDVYGNAETFGKQIGGDILANKKTFLLITAFSEANSEQKVELIHHLTTTNHPQEKIACITELYTQTGAKRLCEEKIRQYFDKALDGLHRLEIAEEKKRELLDLTQNLIVRNH
ncbi:MAG: polyprenyl synthetase family protein [Prevotellaceae bacterium]|jgi:geranylgeranyl diphosphate synthase type II|nr:polyprenyl synthetase family protein [Prevotellaceae bacterium]